MTDEEILGSALGRIVFALGAEVVHCNAEKDPVKAQKVNAVYTALKELWPENVKQIHIAMENTVNKEKDHE